MRAGRLVQVGTPNEIYSAPKDKFVSEFMGDVNVIPVRLNGKSLVAEGFSTGVTAPPVPKGFTAGHLVIRPEFMRFIGKSKEADNSIKGKLYNEYALGSRIQYQVRAGERVYVVEKLRQQAPKLALDQDVLIGWDAADSVLVAD
jgi:spermidine/putrescine transport system ATP-binding protein